MAETGGDLRGHVFLQLIEKIPKPMPGSSTLGYLTNFYVEDGYRGRGVGRALLDALRAHAVAIELDAVVVWPSERSVPLYQRVGFMRRTTCWSCGSITD